MDTEIPVIPPEGDDILDLPRLPPPYRSQCIEQLTDMLIEAEEGRMHAFIASAQMSDSEHGGWGTACDNKFEMAAHMIQMGLRRLAFTTRDDVSQMIEDVLDERGLDERDL